MFTNEWIIQAKERLTPYIVKTPITYDPKLGIFLKWENLQKTGSFKARGALNKILTLQKWEIERGIVTASAGNHGAGVSYACSKIGEKALVFVPENTPPVKLEKIAQYGASIEKIPGGYTDAEQAAITFARISQASYISPYNDNQVIAGQSTIALEVLEQLDNQKPMTWIVPVSGGGLIAGMSAVVKNHDFISPWGKPSVMTVIGVQTSSAPFMHNIYYYGDQSNVVERPTIADGLSGSVEEGSITIPLIKSFVDKILLVNEDEIRTAIKYAHNNYQQTIEASAATTLAAILSKKITERPAILIISGGNIQPQLLQTILEA
jgi:threonine dehydratase